MPNFGAKILNNATGSLSAQQALIATTSNNIANVNTPGYVRRQAQLQTRSSGSSSGAGLDVGNGVEVADVTRAADRFLEDLLRSAAGTQSQSNVKNDYYSRLESLFSLTGSQATIGSTLNEFFSAVNQVSLNPANLELRANVLQRGEDLVNSIRTAWETVAAVQTELDQRISIEVGTVNSLTSKIADLNNRIGQREAQGGTAGDERDQRDLLLQQLSEKMSFTALEAQNGMVSIILPNGFPLVSGATSRNLSVTGSPTFATGTLPPSLSGGVLSYIVYDYGSVGSPAHVDLTQMIKSGSGELGGILQLRGYAATTNTSSFQTDGDLVALASRIESLTRTLLTRVNEEYIGPDENASTAGVREPSSVDLNGNRPSPFGLFDFAYTGAKDVDANGIPQLPDLTGTGLDNFSSRLLFGVSAPAAFAAARDVDSADNSVQLAPGDGRNARALASLRTASITFQTVGSFSATASFDDQFNETVTFVGNAAAAADLDVRVAAANYTAAANRRDEMSAVSLDEEFASLIKYQKAFQASARMIKVATDLLDQIVSLL